MSSNRQSEIERLKKELAKLEKLEAKENSAKNTKNDNDVKIQIKPNAGSTINQYYDESQFDNPMYKSNLQKSEDYFVVAKNITKDYGKKKVLKGINLKIKKGEKIAIIGPNGAGKSTLIEIIAGVKKPSSGEILFAFGNNKLDRSNHLGMQFQETSYPTKVKVKEIIKLILDIQRIKIDPADLDAMINLFNIREIYENRADGLSGGQKQRLNVFLSIIHNPDFLILDEIGAGLDTRSWTFIKKYLMSYIKKYNVTTIAVSHNTDEVMAFAERIIVVNNGTIFEDIMLKDIIARHGTFAKYVDDLFVKKLMINSDFNRILEEVER